jgi:hypothetical protein
MTVVVAKQNRGPGRITSPSRTVPAGGKGKTITLTGLMDTVDMEDASLAMVVGVEWTQDGTNWTTLIAQNWKGHDPSPKTGITPPPTMDISMDTSNQSLLVGKDVRAFADLPRVVNFGMDVTFTG